MLLQTCGWNEVNFNPFRSCYHEKENSHAFYVYDPYLNIVWFFGCQLLNKISKHFLFIGRELPQIMAYLIYFSTTLTRAPQLKLEICSWLGMWVRHATSLGLSLIKAGIQTWKLILRYFMTETKGHHLYLQIIK